MVSVENELKNLIIDRYGNVKAFALSIGLPNSTLDSIFRRGVLKSSVTNIIKICDALDISADELAKGKIVARKGSVNRDLVLTPGEADAIRKYRLLDARGKAAVDSTLSREYAACVSISAAADAAQTLESANSMISQKSAGVK